MVVHRKTLRALTLPFRTVRILILMANFLSMSAACVFVGAFVGYGIALTLSCVFLPAEWTEVLWRWAADLYDGSYWFKVATITFAVLLFLPILRFWPRKDPVTNAALAREVIRLSDELIAARRRGHL